MLNEKFNLLCHFNLKVDILFKFLGKMLYEHLVLGVLHQKCDLLGSMFLIVWFSNWVEKI